MTLPAMQVAGRAPALREALAPAGCDALLVTNLVNVRYLTGFTGSAGMLLIRPGELVLVTDGRYGEQAAEQLAAAGVAARIEVGALAAQRAALAASAQGADHLGLEAGSVTWAAQRQMAGEIFAGTELVPTEGLVESLRLVKDDGEVARIRAAAAIADAALDHVRPLVAKGTTEAEIALSLDFEMRGMGAEDSAFPTIVAAGPNAAKPHARPSSRPIEHGELVVVDFGAVVDGYRSDMTRTLCIGAPRDATLQRVVDVVAESQRAGVAAVAAGRPCAEVDAACRDAVAAAGWADAFVHGTGHGVGLDIHEAPAVSATSGDTLAAGHVVTVEPGVYLPGVGGARIEDTVLVTGAGCEPLTLSPKELIVT